MGDAFPPEAEIRRQELASQRYYNKVKPREKKKKQDPSKFGKIAYIECKNRSNSLRMQNRNLGEIDITPEFLQNLLEKQKNRCAISNKEFSWVPGKKGKPNLYRASVDRIDSNKGYTKDNVQIVLAKLNFMKGDWPDEEFEDLILDSAKYIQKKRRRRSLNKSKAP
jgi:hypothetical protein